MSIGSGDTPPLAAVPGVVETHERGAADRRAKPVRPHAAHPDGAAAESESPVPAQKSVQLPEFPNYELSFRLDKEEGRVVIQVIDVKTGTVVRTLPPKDLGPRLRRLPEGRGVLLDRKG